MDLFLVFAIVDLVGAAILVLIGLAVWIWKAASKTVPVIVTTLFLMFLCLAMVIAGGWYFTGHRTSAPAPVSSLPTTPPIEQAKPTPAPFDGLTINDCPTASLGYHPDSGKPLEFQMYPYVKADGTGDTNVLCIYEVLDLKNPVKVHFSNTVVAIVADWSHGTYNDNGTLKDACPTGWECEGTWVATGDFIIPAGTLSNLHVYIREAPAKQRFTETISWTNPAPAGSMAPFACEYIATQGHSMANIRIPAWAQAQGEVGTIYDFGLPVGNPKRLTCDGYPIDWAPLPGQLTTK